MLNQSFKIIVVVAIAGLILPSLGLAQEHFVVSAPQTVEEAKDLGMTILSKLPEAVKNVWREEALPILQKMRVWFLDFWSRVVWPMLEPWRRKLFDFLGKEMEKRRPEVEEKIWEKFKGLLK